ncbi:hypothetical protein C8R45DRAFT_1107998 [Mycena sanguinolenta]|nr:hypothetical protein C8R45DRAFT_1107998 [Mycena sanguinolenta]
MRIPRSALSFRSPLPLESPSSSTDSNLASSFKQGTTCHTGHRRRPGTDTYHQFHRHPPVPVTIVVVSLAPLAYPSPPLDPCVITPHTRARGLHPLHPLVV